MTRAGGDEHGGLDRSARIVLSVDSLAKVCDGGFECLRDANCAENCRVAAPVLDAADVGLVKLGQFRETFLGQFAGLPQTPDISAQFC